MNILRAFSDRRIEDRLESYSLEITLDGALYRAADWSMSGILVADYDGTHGPGDEVEGSFRICSDMKSHAFKASVIRHNAEKRQLALNFTDLSFRSMSVLEALMAGRKS